MMLILLVGLLTAPVFAQDDDFRSKPLVTVATTEEVGPIYRRNVALIVGIDRYHRDPDIQTLDYARADAEAVADVLRERFGFETYTLYDQEATKEQLFGTLSRLQNEMGERDALLVFWAGHGHTERLYDGSQEGWLIPADGTMDESAADFALRNLSMEELRRTLQRRIPARHKFVIADACYAGVLATRGTVPTLPDYDLAFVRARRRTRPCRF